MDDKQNIETNISLDEIAEYYRDKNEDIYSQYSDDTLESAQDIDDVKTAVYEEDYPQAVPIHSNKKFILFTACVSVIFLVAAFVWGFFIPKAEEDVNFALAHMYDSSKKYTDAQERIKTIKSEMETVQKEIETHRNSIMTITDFESNTGELKSQLAVLTDELNELLEEVEKKQKESAGLDKSIADKSHVTYALNPGIYTVGENINEGSYNINGKGILSVSDADGKLKVNTTLSGNDFSTILYEGDIVKLETKASFTPLEN